MSTTRWAVLGPGAISRDFVTGLRAARLGELHAVGSSSPERAAAFAAEHGATVSGTYDDVLARADVDAVYVGTVHTAHAELAIRALQAGKAVLCEKPVSPTLADTERMLSAAYDARRPFVEAFKNRFGPHADALSALLASGEIGRPLAVEASFGFDAGTRSGRLFDPALAGGAILDVGCYPLSLAVLVADAAGVGGAPTLVAHRGEVVEGVDGHAVGEFAFGGGSVRAVLETSVVRDLPGSATITCEGGQIVLPDAWGGRAESARTIIVRRTGAGEDVEAVDRETVVDTVQPMAAEADAVSLAIAEGRLEVPEMPWSHTRAIADALTVWRAAVLGG